MKIGEEGVYVKDSLSNVGDYMAYGVHFAKAVEFLQRKDFKNLPNGRYELDGSDVYATIQESLLRAWGSARPELHHDYFDIQLPLSGEETIGVGRFSPKLAGEFDETKDIGFYEGAPVEPIAVRPGEFMILHPDTCVHAPCCSMIGAAGGIRKVVIKVHK